MGAENYFALAALPALDSPPSDPPLSPAAFLAGVPGGRPLTLARAVVLSDDLLQREAALAGELPAPDPAVLTRAQVTAEAPLPRELGLADDDASDSVGGTGSDSDSEPDFYVLAPRIAADVVWGAYFRYLDRLATATGSRFLRGWTGWEVSARNALAVARARSLRLDPEPYRVARSLDRGSADVDALVQTYEAATQPLEGFRALLSARWRWIDRQEPWFTFQDDEFAAYAAKLILLHRWQRASEFGPRRHAEGMGEAVS